MTAAEMLTQHLVTAEVDANHTEAVLTLDDGSRLCFCHRVGERWAKAVGREGAEAEPGVAGEILSAIRQFRLNKKHLDISFQDASRFDEPLR
jgi:hypothetical protein